MPLNDALRHRTGSVASALNSHRLLVYSFLSLLAVSAVTTNALRTYSNFYSVAISLSKSNRSVLALINFGFLIALLCGHVVQRIFFGSLRPNEVERLYDRLWFFITESLLAFTIFRDEFDIPFVLMFGFLLFVKSFHWLAGDRIEWMDQRPYPGPPPLFHVRMATLFLILWATDLVMFLIAVENTLANGVGGMVLFASEYGILMASVLNTISKYLLTTYELRRAGRRGGENAPPWEHKSMWVFYIELATDFFKLTTYLIFFTIIIAFYGLPLNIVRDVYITARSFITRLRALQRYQTATRNMDQRYPNATAEELSSMSDRTCIICREEMISHGATPAEGHAHPGTDGPNTTPKKLPCGHIFHFHCLRSWLERQQSCPTCRRTVLDTPTQDQNAGVRAAPPAVDPQRGNAPAPGARAQNQNRGANNPFGNPLGLIGRFFGPPAQQPRVPGQPPQPQPLQHVNNAHQNPGNLQEVVIQYHIQYQPQLQQQQQPQNSQQSLHPPPPFPGFTGPGGAWQHWPTGQQRPSQHGQAAQQAPTPAISSEALFTPPEDLQNIDPSPPVVEEVAAREAAARAALRRSNISASGTPSSSRVTETVMQGTSREPASAPITSSNPTSIPSLIPLYDYSALGAQAHGHLPASLNSTTQMALGNIGTRVNHLGQFGTSLSLGGTPTGTSDTIRLPPILTDEQLSIMDRLTREAIDERLRVLEGVSSAVYRCMDDLMRMRSALPPLSPSANANTAAAASSSTSSANRQNGVYPEKASTSTVPNGTSHKTTTNGKAPEVSAPSSSSEGLSGTPSEQ